MNVIIVNYTPGCTDVNVILDGDGSQMVFETIEEAELFAHRTLNGKNKYVVLD